MWGSLIGDFTGTIYYLFFQLIGYLLICFVLKNKDFCTRILCGSVLGAVLLQWTPALMAFPFSFSLTAHVIVVALFCLRVPHAVFFPTAKGGEFRAAVRKHRVFVILFVVTFCVFCYMLHTHTLSSGEDGLHTGQCSYGDMNFHLGVITSIARQQKFPPEYSISPGDKLCYPFLCDSISSSVYLFGASLRYAYMLPMIFALGQVLLGFYCFAYTWLKRVSKAVLAWVFFFYNGGFGFVYFFDWIRERTYTFPNIFTEYYQTPTNLVNNNIRWVNVIVDMLLPQRATLFGYAVLFTCVWLLWRAVYNKEKDLLPTAAVLTAALPMIHTHSFLAMGMISAAWLLVYLHQNVRRNAGCKYSGKILLTAFLAFMCLVQIVGQKHAELGQPSFYMFLCLLGVGIMVAAGVICLIHFVKEHGAAELFRTWGKYLLLILIFAVPQLLYWTFGQASHSGFISGHFNWSNQGDQYLWFYLKNWGVIVLLLIPAVFYCTRRNFAVLSAGFVIWFVVELVAFSPNTYDNNKLLYIAYAFFCCISADYGYALYRRCRRIKGAVFYGTVFLCCCSVSSVLTIGREVVSDYTVYSNAHVEAAEFVDQNTPPDAVFLTNDRHVNEVAALAGRNIVSGSGSWLATHGIYDGDRAADVKNMYESPETSQELFQEYGVDYIMISSWERGSYDVQEEKFDAMFECIYHGNGDEIKIYKMN